MKKIISNKAGIIALQMGIVTKDELNHLLEVRMRQIKLNQYYQDTGQLEAVKEFERATGVKDICEDSCPDPQKDCENCEIVIMPIEVVDDKYGLSQIEATN